MQNAITLRGYVSFIQWKMTNVSNPPKYETRLRFPHYLSVQVPLVCYVIKQANDTTNFLRIFVLGPKGETLHC